jgi:hypothetical protein
MSAAAIIADALVVELNATARTWTGQLTAQAQWNQVLSLDPASGLPQLTTDPILTVIPDSVPVKTRMTRGPVAGGTMPIQGENHVIFFLLQAKLQTTAGVAPQKADIDPLTTLLESVTDYFFADGHFVAAANYRCKCVEARIETYCYRPDLEDKRCYTGCAALTFEVIR